MQLEPSKLHQSSGKKNCNQYGASSLQAGRAGDWINAAADIPQTGSPKRSSPLPQVAPDNCVPHHPCHTQEGCYKGFLSNTQPPRLPKRGQDWQCCGWRKTSRKGIEGLCPAASLWGKATLATQFSLCAGLSSLLLVLYTPWWLLREPLLLPALCPQLPKPPVTAGHCPRQLCPLKAEHGGGTSGHRLEWDQNSINSQTWEITSYTTR